MNRIFTIALVMTSCAALFACGGEDPGNLVDPTANAGPDVVGPPPLDKDGSTTPEGSFSVAVQPNTIEAAYGSKTTVPVSIARTGPVGDVALSVKAPPAGITATFAPDTVLANENGSTLTLTIGDDAPLGASTLTVVGSSGGKESTVELALTVKTITVNGKLSPGSSGVTVVLVDGQRVTTTTGDGGAFTFKDVKPPYDLYSIWHTDSATAFITDKVVYYKGLTRPDPTIESPILSSGGVLLPPNKAKISGTLSGTALPLSTNNALVLVWTGSSDMAVRVSGGNAYSFEPTWLGLSIGKRTGTVYALQTDNGLGTWRGYAEAAVALGNGDSATVDLQMTAPVNAKVTGTITAPSGFPAPTTAMSFHFGSHEYSFGTLTAPSPFDFFVPVAPNLTTSLLVSSKLAGAVSEVSFSGIKAATDVTYALRTPPTFNTPASASTVNLSTSFTWAAPADAVSVAQWTVGKVHYTVFTAAPSATVPTIPETSFAPDNGSWTVDVYGPMSSVDELAGPKGRELDSAPVRYHATTDGARPFVWAP